MQMKHCTDLLSYSLDTLLRKHVLGCRVPAEGDEMRLYSPGPGLYCITVLQLLSLAGILVGESCCSEHLDQSVLRALAQEQVQQQELGITAFELCSGSNPRAVLVAKGT